MLQLTDTAAQELRKIKDQAQEQAPGSIPRLVRKGEKEFGLTIDAAKDGDQELFCADEKILLVDQQTSEILEDITLDFKETKGGQAFVFEGGLA